MHGWGLFFFLLFLFVVLGVIAYVVLTQYRARSAGLPPPAWKSYIPFLKSGDGGNATNYPTPRAAGPIDWVKDFVDKLRNRRTARGSYEEASLDTPGGYNAGTGLAGDAGGRRGRGVDEEAWDAGVGNEDGYEGHGGYYEEQELGLAPTPGLHSEPYSGAQGGSYLGAGGSGGGYGDERGRSKSRDNSAQAMQNPFGDQNEAPSLREMSPKPESMRGHRKEDSTAGPGDSPMSTRRSMFREGL